MLVNTRHPVLLEEFIKKKKKKSSDFTLFVYFYGINPQYFYDFRLPG